MKTAATALFEKGLYGPARSLAISALEELGKIGLVHNFLTGEITAEEFVSRAIRHKPKQAIGALVTFFPANFAHLFGPGPVESFSELARNVKQNVEQFSDALIEESGPFMSLVKSLERGTLEKNRQDGLYVSIARANDTLRVQHPRLVSDQEAQALLQALSVLDSSVLHTILNVQACIGGEEAHVGEVVSIETVKSVLDKVFKSVEAAKGDWK